MSYLDLLDEAAAAAAKGDLLEGERRFEAARQAWEASRIRAPLVEKGIEPVLRWGGRLLGRRSEEPVLPTFEHRAERARRALEECARLGQHEIRELLTRAAEDFGPAEAQRLETGLRWMHESEVFQLPPESRWPLLRAYLTASRRNGREVEASLLLSPDLLDAEARAWVGEWADEGLRAALLRRAELANWLLGVARRVGEDDAPVHRARWKSRAARLALLASDDGPAALRFGRDALDDPHLVAEEAVSTLRLVAGLVCNETHLAVDGSRCGEDLAALGPTARRLDVAWPPPELQELLHRRTPDAPKRALVAAAWSEGGENLLLVRHHVDAPCDALLLRLREGAELGRGFERSPHEARRAIERWTTADTVFLLESSPPAAIVGVLGPRPRLVVSELERVIPSERRPAPPRDPVASHPLWAEEDRSAWSPLLRPALALLPRLAAWLDSDAFRTNWGRRNLRALGGEGLEVGHALVRVLDGLDPAPVTEADDDDLQVIPLGVDLQWPRLPERPWPHGDRSPVRRVEALEGDFLFARHPSPAELTARALGDAPSFVVAADPQRALEIAETVAATEDPRRVGIEPEHPVCPLPLLRRFERWLGESLSRPERALDVLWLYRALAQCPAGDVQVGLERGGTDQGRDEVASLLREQHRCDGDCDLQGYGGCFVTQLDERRARSAVWIGSPESPAPSGPARALLYDDLCQAWGAVDDRRATRRREALPARIAEHPRVRLWSDAGMLRAVQRELLQEWMPEGRTLRLHADESKPAARLWVAPAGFEPSSPLLGEESRDLLELRWQAWVEARGESYEWNPEGRRSHATGRAVERSVLRGRASRPSAREVGVSWLAGESVQDDLLLSVRLATAATHATDRLVCFDARAAKRLGAAADPVPEGMRALGPGSRLLFERLGRSHDGWKRPLTASRLLRVAEGEGSARLEAVATACGAIEAGSRWVLAGLVHRERTLLREGIRRLAREAGDGGPLRSRCVVWVGEANDLDPGDERARWIGPDELDRVEPALQELETGRVDLLVVHPLAMGSGAFDRWARRTSQVAWVASQAERAWPETALGDAWPSGLLDGLREIAASTDSLLLAFVDDPGDLAHRVADRLQAEVRAIEPALGLEEAWRWRRVRPDDPRTACARCGVEGAVAHPHCLCEACGSALVDPHLQARELRDAVLDRAFDRLGEAPSHARWLVVAEDAAATERLRTRLGVAPFAEGEAPLLSSAARPAFDREVLQAGELWSTPVEEADLLLTRVPRDPRWLRALLWRLHTLGWKGGTLHVLDHPVQWLGDLPADPREELDPAAELAGRAVAWQAARAEVEFRYRTALESIVEVLRRRAARHGDAERGLGPPTDPHALPRLAPLALAIDRALALEGSAPLLELGVDAATEAVQARANWIVDLIASLADQGVRFESPSPRVLVVSDLSERSERAGILAALLVWCAREGLLRVQSERKVGSGRSELATWPRRRWLARARETAEGVAAALPVGVDPIERGQEDGTEPATAPFDLRPSGRALGIAGSGRSTELVRQGAALLERGTRPLLLAPSPLAIAALHDAHADTAIHALEVATVAELALAFLRARSGSTPTAARPRLVPPAASPEGEEIRRRLARETSRLYAMEAGRVPGLEASELARWVEGEAPLARMAAEGDAVDPHLLQRCAERARRDAGWLHAADLRNLSRRWLADHPQDAHAWRERYASVLVDDVHTLHPDQLDFLDRLFPAPERWDVADPILLERVEESSFRAAEMQSRRMPRDVVRGLERLWRDLPPLPARIKARPRSRGRLETRPVLNLEACVRALGEIQAESADKFVRRVVVLGHEQDRRHLAARLREDGHRVWMAEAVARLVPPGPRELLACLLLAHELPSLETSIVTDLVALLVRAIPGPTAGVDLDRIVPRLRRAQSTGEFEPVDRVESWLAPLCDARLRGDPRDSFEATATRVLRSGLLRGVLRRDAARGRLADLLDEEGARSWSSVRERLDPAAVARPFAPGPQLWVARPEDLVGLEFDHVILLCTGYEPVERHYAVASRARDRVSVLHSERDPFSDRA